MTGCPTDAYLEGTSRMPGRERPGRTFPVHVHLAPLAVDVVFLELGDIVRHVVPVPHLHVLGLPVEHGLERLADPVHDHLPVSPGEVGTAAHAGEIVLAVLGIDRGAGQLSVGQVQVHRLQGAFHDLQVVGGDLVPASARAAVDGDGVFVLMGQPERLGRLWVGTG